MKLTDSSLGYNNISKVSFNTLQNDPAYVGYMYGNTLGSSYDETYANENNSTIKQYLDSWYKQNILNKGYADYIADSGFCNDRSLSVRNSNGDGVNTTGDTYYAGYTRFFESQTPSLICPNTSNDLFTTSTSNKGNKTLTYPIGLITVDELMLSGTANNYFNRSLYTYSSSSYWTMSSRWFFSGASMSASELNFTNLGTISGSPVSAIVGVRGVINLKGDTQISGGIGTANDPFVIKESV